MSNISKDQINTSLFDLAKELEREAISLSADLLGQHGVIGQQQQRIAELEAEVAAVRAHVIADEGDIPRVDTAQSVAAIVEQRDWLIESVRRTELERDELRARLAEIEEQEPLFYYRPINGGLYEGPHWAKSICGKMQREERPGEWVPLYARPVPAQAVPDVTNAACDVLAERRRQVSAEGYDHQHDDAHICDEIAAAACFYAMPPGAREWDTSSTGYGDTLGDAIVPDGWVLSAGSRRRDLVKAGALILAEIERMDRAAAPERKA